MPKTAVTGSLLSFALDRQCTQPLHRQLLDQLRLAIESGRLPGGSKLPSTRIFADEIGVSRNTVLQVFDALTAEGFLQGKVGSGSFVVDQAEQPDMQMHQKAASPWQGHGYPFRSLSRRGRRLVASSTDEFAEKPRPFMPDVPDLREFPIKTWLRLLSETSGRLTGEILASTSNAGYEPLRRALAQHLNASRGMSCTHEQIVITTGSQQSLDLTCRMLLDPGDPVWMEEPGYIGARSVIRANGGAVCPVPVDKDGICVESASLTHPVPRLIFVSPSRHYPLGMTLSVARREMLLKFARNCGSWIVEDDYDHEFRYAGHSPQAIHGMDRDARTIHIGTFSKILLPSFRLGYMVIPSDLCQAFGKARAIVDRHASLIEQMVMSELLLRGLLVSHIRRMRVLYRTRQNQLIEGLRKMFGADLQLETTETGTHVIVLLKPGTDDTALARLGVQVGLIMRPLSPYYATRQTRQGLLLGFAAFNPLEIETGLEKLRAISDSLAPFVVRNCTTPDKLG